MKYYKVIKPGLTKEFLLLDKIYREDFDGEVKHPSRVSIEKWLTQSFYNKEYLKEVTQLEYLRSINLKEKLIELAESSNYSIILNSKAEAKKVDKIFCILNHSAYLISNKSILENWQDDQHKLIHFNLKGLSTGNDSKIKVTLKELLDYV